MRTFTVEPENIYINLNDKLYDLCDVDYFLKIFIERIGNEMEFTNNKIHLAFERLRALANQTGLAMSVIAINVTNNR